MKVISIWQPFASLLMHRHKICETRTWPCPPALIGQRIGIASTKVMKADQRAVITDPQLVAEYQRTGMPDIEELPHGCILGTVRIVSCEEITARTLQIIPSNEYAFGFWEPGYWAWRTADPEIWKTPVPVQGRQGIWDFNDETGAFQELQSPLGEAGTENVWGRNHPEGTPTLSGFSQKS